ncbi:hypothetical protein [Cellulomonas hominis]|uniref:hypothetical protein n=1 Tax=Cellulomonas hominis TaxID=156981 RepID=UPI001B971B81|nr:hypothetical protein [Cellulomonas hominis]VTR78312.1 hypothetical protein CHMI_03091 [Cellulomonas hominis]
MADVTEVAAGLYGVAPAEFTAARTAAVRAARASGDKAVATAVGALRKPSAAAAAVNLLVRERPEDVGRLLDLGVRLREAQAALSGTDLRALHAEQQRMMTEVVQVAVDLLADAGGTVGAAARGQVEATLRAAMGDPDAAAAVATGLLVRDLFSSGFEPVDVDGAVAVPDAPPLAGAPARRTPMRAVPAERERPDAAPDDQAGRPGRRRGRLITVDEPDRPVQEVPPARARGRVRTAESGTGDQEAAPASPRERSAKGRAGTGTAGDRRAREAEDRRAREAEQRRAREAAQAAERERRREAARRSAEEDVALARQDAQEQREARDAADRRLKDAEARQAELADLVERTQQEIARLRDELAVAEQEARETGLEVRHARSARTAAARAAERAESRLRAAETHLDAL